MFFDRIFRKRAAAAVPESTKAISMLSAESLALLAKFARESDGPVIEIGAYVGGATIVLARALAGTLRKLICVEVGGEHPTHPLIPSRDILGDWRRNIAAAGLKEPTLIEGYSWHPKVLRALEEALCGERAGLLL